MKEAVRRRATDHHRQPRLVEARWLVVLAMLAMLFLFTTTPYRVRSFPH
jgi:hypothetical protein